MDFETREGKTEWDLRQYRLEMIGKLSQEKTMIYLQTIREKELENLKDYFYILKAIYRNIKGYAKKQEKTEKLKEIDELIEELDEKLEADQVYEEERREIFQELEDLEDEIQELRMDVGLDIPQETEYDPENAGVQGLR